MCPRSADRSRGRSNEPEFRKFFPMGTHPADGRAPVRRFHSASAWIEGAAVEQLETVAGLAGVTAVAAMPDLHPGRHGPVGCAVLSDRLHPRLVGTDIGCGMALFATDLPVRRIRLDRTAERLRVLEGPFDGDAGARLAEAGLDTAAWRDHDAGLGTIGGGNHFCELQAVDAVLDAETAAVAGLDRDLAVILVHSGSRSLGAAVFDGFVAGGAEVIEADSEAGRSWLAGHDHAVAWAAANRRLIAERAAGALGADLRLLTDLPHNFVEATPAGWLHRKGAAPADRGLVPVPGSRATPSFLVRPSRDADAGALASLAHGAGRKFDRASMHHRIGTKKSDLARLARNPAGGFVVCEDRALLVEEAPEAYKSAERVVEDLAFFGLAVPVVRFRPLVTFKTARAGGDRGRAEGRHRDDGGRQGREARR